MMAMVAGTAPAARTISSTSRAVRDILRIGHAMGDDGRFECHDGASAAECGVDFFSQVQLNGHTQSHSKSSNFREPITAESG